MPDRRGSRLRRETANDLLPGPCPTSAAAAVPADLLILIADDGPVSMITAQQM
jgi:hypothetical protein